MKYILAGITLVICTLNLPVVYAVTILECIDETGNSTFQEHCPPGSTAAAEHDISTGTSGNTAAATSAKKPAPIPGAGGDATITFYTTSADCDACVVIKGVLSKYGASFTEKDIKTDMAARQELKDKVGGTGNTVSVPTVIINGQVIAGFNKEAVAKALEDAGYNKPESAPPAPEPRAK